MTGRILIVEDDRDLRDGLERFLQTEGFDVFCLDNADGLLEAIEAHRIGVVVLDLNLPGSIDGFTAAERIRAETRAAVVMLTGRTLKVDRMRGFGLGAINYLDKPADPAELALVLRNISAMLHMPRAPGGSFDWRLRFDRWLLVGPDGTNIRLTMHERHLLEVLASRPGEPSPRPALLVRDATGGIEDDGRGLDLIVHRLRRKGLAECGVEVPIMSVRGVGYRFAGTLVRVD